MQYCNGIHLVKGHHEPLISFETYQKIQERLNGEAKAPVRKDISDDFPLRGFLACDSCGAPMTSCWSQGRTGLYPYYLCHRKGCALQKKSIRKEKIESDFEKLLGNTKPSKELILLAVDIFTNLWNEKRETVKMEAEHFRQNILQIERKTEQFLDRITETDSQTSITTYEKKSEDWRKKKLYWMRT